MTVSVTFWMLTIAHYYEGNLYFKKSISKLRELSPNYWKWATFFYEGCIVMICEITACFWLIVFPFMVTEEPKDKDVPYNDELLRKRKIRIIVTYIAISFAHVLPFCAIAVDFRKSAFKFYTRHIYLVFAFALLYISYHLFQTFCLRGPDEEPIYPSHDWYNHPIRSILLTVLCFVILWLIFNILVRLSDHKIKKAFPDGQVYSYLQLSVIQSTNLE